MSETPSKLAMRLTLAVMQTLKHGQPDIAKAVARALDDAGLRALWTAVDEAYGLLITITTVDTAETVLERAMKAAKVLEDAIVELTP